MSIMNTIGAITCTTFLSSLRRVYTSLDIDPVDYTDMHIQIYMPKRHERDDSKMTRRKLGTPPLLFTLNPSFRAIPTSTPYVVHQYMTMSFHMKIELSAHRSPYS
jgi:hypothetical protein